MTRARQPIARALMTDVWRHLRDRAQRPAPALPEGRGAARMRVENEAGLAKVYLYEEIGFWGIWAEDFVDELLRIDAATIELHINSPGGDVFDGVAMYNALVDHHATVNVVVDGLAASAASFIAQAGDSVTMNRASQMMIHDASGLCIGNAADMDQMRALLDRCSDTIAGIYAARASGDLEEWRTAMRAESWYSATEAVAVGLADSAVAEKAADPAAARAVFDLRMTSFQFAGRAAAPPPAMPGREQPGTAGVDEPTTPDGPAPRAEAAPVVPEPEPPWVPDPVMFRAALRDALHPTKEAVS
jgi:ATP-dependent protease ClpP protease subunit